MPVIIQTSQAPDAKPIGLSVSATTDWTSIIEVPSYDIPSQQFGGGRDVVPGVAEIISPMLLSNKTSSTETISIRVYRASSNTVFTIANQIPVPPNDIMPIPLNGQFIFTDDTLDIVASANSAVDVTISYTVGQAEEDDVV